MNELISFLENQDVEYQKGKMLSALTSVGIGGVAKLFISPNSKEKFAKTLKYLYDNKIRHHIVGNMTNILPSDDDIESVLVSTLKIDRCTVEDKTVYADCGVLFSRLIQRAGKNSLGGYEALFGIPGTVGAMLSINAGAYGVSASDFLNTVEVYDSRDGYMMTLKKEDVAFFYRGSELKKQGLTVLGATFSLIPSDKQKINYKIKQTIDKRKATQPIGSKTLGSVFKRTDSLPASFMIDRCGLKGIRIGNIEVSEKHAGFFVNKGGGTSSDFLKLTEIVKNKVKQKYGITLEEEFEYLI